MSRSIIPLALALASCNTTEPAMSAPTPPPKILSPFKQLRGGGAQFIPAGEPVTAIGGGLVTSWDHDKAVEVALPPNTNPYGARWAPDRKSLRVGLGAVDLATKTWRAEPGLQTLNPIGPSQTFPVRWTAWFGDATHVALVLETRDPRGGETHEIAIAETSGKVRGKGALPGPVKAIIAGQDRVLVDAYQLVLFDLDAKVVAEPKLATSALRVSEGAGMFAVTLNGGKGVVLLRPSDGAVIATWNVAANDAVPVAHGVVAVADDGTVHVGCIDGSAVKEVTTAKSGATSPIVQLAGSQLVVAGASFDPVHVAEFTNPCK